MRERGLSQNLSKNNCTNIIFLKWWFKITIYHKNIYLSYNRLKCSAYLIIKGEDCNSSIL